jgi:hypothetical protein
MAKSAGSVKPEGQAARIHGRGGIVTAAIWNKNVMRLRQFALMLAARGFCIHFVGQK